MAVAKGHEWMETLHEICTMLLIFHACSSHTHTHIYIYRNIYATAGTQWYSNILPQQHNAIQQECHAWKQLMIMN